MMVAWKAPERASSNADGDARSDTPSLPTFSPSRTAMRIGDVTPFMCSLTNTTALLPRGLDFVHRSKCAAYLGSLRTSYFA